MCFQRISYCIKKVIILYTSYFTPALNFVNSQRENTNSKSDFVLKTLIKLRQHLSFPDNIFQYKYLKLKDIYSFSDKI